MKSRIEKSSSPPLQRETPTSNTSSPTLTREKRKEVRFPGVKQTHDTYNPDPTPRDVLDEVNRPTRSNVRTEAKENLLAALLKEDTPLGKKVRSAAVKTGRKETHTLRETLQSVLTGSISYEDDARVADQLAVDVIAKEVASLDDKDNPLVDVGKYVCVAVARKLVKRLALWTDVNMAMEQANVGIAGQKPLKDHVPVAARWKGGPLNLSPTQANGLYMLAQEVGQKVGKKMKEKDVVHDRLSSLKKHCSPGGDMAIAIDLFYERIAKRVAIEMAESLVSQMRKFPKAMYSEETRSPDIRSKRLEILKTVPPAKSSAVQSPSDEEVRITSPGNPASIPAQRPDSSATEQSPRIAGVPDLEVTTTSPENPETTGGPGNSNI